MNGAGAEAGGADILAVDVGNTSTVYGFACQGEVLRRFRVRTHRDDLPDDLALKVAGMCRVAGFKLPPQAVLSSVAPPVGTNLRVALEALGCRAFEVSAQALPGVTVELAEPGSVGADRLCNLLGARRYFEPDTEHVVVVDFGTSTNFDVIGRGDRFVGGILATGAQVSADALFARAAKLPRIALVAPERALGRSTAHALQSGLVFGYAEMVDGLLRRLKAELGGEVRAVATGGFARTVEGICRELDAFDDDLTLRGLLLAHGQMERGG